jgi:NADH:ubiquinone oxidoreductase subunit 6 (subunit J)
MAVETTFSAPVLSGLIGAVMMLTLVMMMMFDLVRNMWSWSQPYTLNSGLMDWLLSLFGIR